MSDQLNDAATVSDPPKKKGQAVDAPKGRLRAFAGNSFEDYYDSAMSDFPWTARWFMNFIIAVL